MPRLLRELAVAARQARRAPLASAAFVITIALAVGVNTAVFDVVRAALFRLPDVADISQVVVAPAPGICGPLGPGGASECHAPDWFDRVTAGLSTLAPIGAFGEWRASVAVGDRNAIVFAESVWRDYFAALGVRPTLGRLLTRDDSSGAGAQAAVVSSGFWREWLGGRDDVIGQTLTVAGRRVVVVGVAPDGFRGLARATQVWVPWTEFLTLGSTLVARLTPQSSAAAAADELRSRTAGVYEDAPERRLELRSLRSWLLDSSLRTYVVIAVLLMAPVLILVIATINLVSLVFARFSGRLAEMATRVMLGATRTDLIRLLAGEIAVLTAMGAGLGVALAALGTRMVSGRIPIPIQLDLRLEPDLTVLGYGLLAAALAGLVAILTVSARVTETDALTLMATTTGAGTVTFRSAPLRTRLIAAQTICAVVLLVLAGLFWTSANAVAPDQSAGLDLRHAAAGVFNHDWHRTPEAGRERVNGQLLAAARATPGVEHSALVTYLPGYPAWSVSVESRSDGRQTRGYVTLGTADFASAIGLDILRGRTFTADEVDRRASVLVISEAMAATLWPGQNAVGRHIHLDVPDAANFPDEWTIVGVASTVKGDARRPFIENYVYLPMADWAAVRLPTSTIRVLVRGSDDGDVLAGRLGRSVHAALPDATLTELGPLSDQFGASSQILRLMGSLLSGLGTLGATLAAVGLFGVIAHTAGFRRREFAIMRAFGATDALLYRQAAREGTRMLVLGIVPGLVAAMLVSRVLRFYFIGLRWFEWSAFLLVPALVLLVGLAACVLPVRQVLRQTPLTALRDER